MSNDERRKSAASSHGEHVPDHARPQGHGDRRPAKEHADRGDDLEAEHPRREHQPGGGHHSESEKPDAPDSRWGGGR